MQKFACVVCLLVVLALGVLNLAYDFGPEPDEVFPMANQHIEWNSGK